MDYEKALGLFFFTVSLASTSDQRTKIAAKALLPLEKDEEKRKKYQAVLDAPDLEYGAFKKLKEFAAMNSETKKNKQTKN